MTFLELVKTSEGFQYSHPRFVELIRSLRDGVYSIIIMPREAKKVRSLQQNSYYWGVVIKHISDHLGYTDQETHELMKVTHNAKNLIVNGEEIKIGISTSVLSTIQFEEYLEKIRQWASIYLGVSIPLPHEVILQK